MTLKIARSQQGSILLMVLGVAFLAGTVGFTVLAYRANSQRDLLSMRTKDTQESVEEDIRDALGIPSSITRSMKRFAANRSLVSQCGSSPAFGAATTPFNLVSDFESTVEPTFPSKLIAGGDAASASSAGFTREGRQCALFANVPNCVIQSMLWIGAWTGAPADCTVDFYYTVRTANLALPSFAGGAFDYKWVKALSAAPYVRYRIQDLGAGNWQADIVP